MAYIGKEPIVGNFQKCDAITVVNGQAAYTLQVSSTNVVPESANHMLVSLNGILQAPITSFTVSSSTLTFASNLATGDVIDFVILLGNVLDLGVPSDDTVGAAQIKNDLISGTTALGVAPADTDEFLVSDAGTLKRIDYSLIKGGGILQLKSANESARLTTTSSSYIALTNLSVTLTPSSSSNKVLVLINVSGSGANGSNAGGACALYRGGSILADANGDAASNRTRAFAQLTSGNGSQEWMVQSGGLVFLDNPSTTSATTYQVYWRCEDTSGGSVLNGGYNDSDSSDRVRLSSNITVMEIGSTIL